MISSMSANTEDVVRVDVLTGIKLMPNIELCWNENPKSETAVLAKQYHGTDVNLFCDFTRT